MLEFDAGMQVRRFRFGASSPAGARSLQGDSRGSMVPAATEPRHLRAGCANAGRVARGGHDEPAQPGYLRPNGVPYSERAVVKEFFDSFTLADDGTWLIVTTVSPIRRS